MSRLVLSLALVLGLAGCNAESGPVTLVNFHSLLPASGTIPPCSNPTQASPLWGFGDLNVGFDLGTNPNHTEGYYLGLHLKATLGSPAGNSGILTVNGTDLDTFNRDVPVIDEMVVEYRLTPAVVRIPTYHFPMNVKFDVQSNNSDIFWGAANLLSNSQFLGTEGAAELLRDNVLQGTPVDLRALVQFRGHMSRSGAAVSTAADSAPIRVYNEPPAGTCVTPRVMVPACPFPGQDGDGYTCCDDVPVGTKVTGCP